MALDATGRTPAEYIGRRALLRHRSQHPFFGTKIGDLFRERTRRATSEYEILVDAGTSPENYGVYGFRKLQRLHSFCFCISYKLKVTYLPTSAGDVCRVYAQTRNEATAGFIAAAERYADGGKSRDGQGNAAATGTASARRLAHRMSEILPLLTSFRRIRARRQPQPRPPSGAKRRLSLSSSSSESSSLSSSSYSDSYSTSSLHGSRGSAESLGDMANQGAKTHSRRRRRRRRRSHHNHHRSSVQQDAAVVPPSVGLSMRLAQDQLRDWVAVLRFFRTVVTPQRKRGAAPSGARDGADDGADASGRFQVLSLQVAAIKGDAESIASLVNADGVFDSVDHDGKTALHYAAHFGFAGVIDELIEEVGRVLTVLRAEADGERQQQQRRCRRRERKRGRERSRHSDDGGKLTGNSDPNSAAAAGPGAAAPAASLSLAHWINQVDRSGYPALFYAIRGGHLAAVDVLLKAGADPQFDRLAEQQGLCAPRAPFHRRVLDQVAAIDPSETVNRALAVSKQHAAAASKRSTPPLSPTGAAGRAEADGDTVPRPLTAHQTAILVLGNHRCMAYAKQDRDRARGLRAVRSRITYRASYTPDVTMKVRTLQEMFPRIEETSYEPGLEVAERMVERLLLEDDVRDERRRASLRSFAFTFIPYACLLILVTVGAAWSKGLVGGGMSAFTMRTGLRSALAVTDDAWTGIASAASLHAYLEETLAPAIFPDRDAAPPAALSPDSGNLARTVNLQHNVIVGALRLRTVRTGSPGEEPGSGADSSTGAVDGDADSSSLVSPSLTSRCRGAHHALAGFVLGSECFPRFAPRVESRGPYGAPPYTWSASPGGAAFTSAYDGDVRYPAAGYVVDIDPRNGTAARASLAALRTGGFVDRATRAVFVDMLIGNPSSAALVRARLVVEFPPEGGARVTDSIRVVSLAATAVPWLLHLVASALMIVYTTAEVRDMLRFGPRVYLSEFYNWLDLVNAGLFAAITVVKVMLLVAGPAVRFDLAAFAAPGASAAASFIDADGWIGLAILRDDLSAIFVLFAWGQCIKYIVRLPGFGQVIAALIDTVTDRRVFLFILFSISFLWSVTIGAHLLLGQHAPGFATVSLSMLSVVRAMVGDGLASDGGMGGAPSWQPVFLELLIVVVMQLLLINLFIAIISESYAAASEHRGDVWNRSLTDRFVYSYIKAARRADLGLRVPRAWRARHMLQGLWLPFDPRAHRLAAFAVSDKAIASLEVEHRLAEASASDLLLMGFLQRENVRSDGSFDHALATFDEQASDLRSVGRQRSLFRDEFFRAA
jgi:hypothetical protein